MLLVPHFQTHHRSVESYAICTVLFRKMRIHASKDRNRKFNVEKTHKAFHTRDFLAFAPFVFLLLLSFIHSSFTQRLTILFKHTNNNQIK
jgi:hypothetical protein